MWGRFIGVIYVVYICQQLYLFLLFFIKATFTKMGACVGAKPGEKIKVKQQSVPQEAVAGNPSLQKSLLENKDKSALQPLLAQPTDQIKLPTNSKLGQKAQQNNPQSIPNQPQKSPTISMMLQEVNDPNVKASDLQKRMSGQQLSKIESSHGHQSKIEQSIKQSSFIKIQQKPREYIQSYYKQKPQDNKPNEEAVKFSSITNLHLKNNNNNQDQIPVPPQKISAIDADLKDRTGSKFQAKVTSSHLEQQKNQSKKFSSMFENRSKTGIDHRLESKIQHKKESKIDDKIQDKAVEKSSIDLKKQSNILNSKIQQNANISAELKQGQNIEQKLYSFNNKAPPSQSKIQQQNSQLPNIHNSLIYQPKSSQIHKNQSRPYNSSFTQPKSQKNNSQKSNPAENKLFGSKIDNRSSISKDQDYVPNQSVANFGPGGEEFQYNFDINVNT